MGLLLQIPAPGIAGQCKIQLLEVPVTMNGLHPTITAQINGKDALFTLDSGAFFSSITPAAAAQYQLRPDSTRRQDIIGADGPTTMKIATVSTFTIFNLQVPRVEFLVGGNDSGTAGLLGQNVLRIADIEYDLAQGAVRFLKTTDCKKANLAYWAKPGESYSLMDIEMATPTEPHTIGAAYLNGVKMRVWFDTGATTSIVGLRAAERAGIKPGGPGVEEAEAGAGMGRNRVKTWIGTFPSFKIGDEEIHNARLRFGYIGGIDMLLGADFFLSHHVLVASSQSKLYFTYNGGPVFNYAAALARAKSETSTPETPTSSTDTPTADAITSDASKENSAPAPGQSDTADAPALARRAAGYAARHDYEHALQDYNRACELAPKEATYFYQRALIQLNSNRMEAGAADIETALNLNPGYIDAHFVRAEIKLRQHAPAEAVKDLATVDQLAAKEAAIRRPLAGLFEDANDRKAAIAQLNLWIAHHTEDVNLPDALNSRCWDRAVLNEALDQALDDCNAAVRLRRNSQPVLDSRGFVHLRRKEFDKAIADYDAALHADPKAAFSLYCRGVAKSLAGKGQDGSKDMSAAIAQDPHVVEQAKLYGIDVPRP